MKIQSHWSGSTSIQLDKSVGWAFLYFLLAIDALFIGLHLVHKLGSGLSDPRFSLETDRGHAEIFQYLKTIGIALLLASLFGRTRQLTLAVWAALFAFLFVDDARQVHERIGNLLAVRWNLPVVLGLPSRDLGQLIAMCFVGGVFVAALAFGYPRSSVQARRATADLLLLLAALTMFGLVIDTVHAALKDIQVLGGALAVLEDGGEMLTMSVIFVYVYVLRASDGALAGTLWHGLSRRAPPTLGRWLDRLTAAARV
jgi:hypothetical protein